MENFLLRWHAEHGSNDSAERARLVLEAEAGGSPGQVAASMGLSPQTVAGVLAQFERDRLATFPRPSLRLDQLTHFESADNLRRQHVARQARRLFNDTRPLHHLHRRARQLLEAAALLPPVTRPTSTVPNAKRELDLLDGTILADLGPAEQACLSCVLHLQNRAYRADRDAAFKLLRPAEQSQVRYLAALLQVAAELDHSGTHSTTLRGAELLAETVVLRLMGPNAEADGTYACRRSWLWQPVFHTILDHVIGPRSAAVSQAPEETADGDEPVGAVFGRQLAAGLRLWDTSLPGAASTDFSSTNDLLAGVTQVLATLGAFSSVLKRRPVKDVKRPLRVLHDALASVSEQQNALNDLEVYIAGRPPSAVAELQPLREAWERAGRRQHTAARAVMQSADVTQLYATLTKMAQTPPVRRRKFSSIRVAAPVLLEELCADLAERQEMVATDRPQTYQRYRDGLARLACALEALGGKAAMGEEANRLLADVQRMESRIERWLASNALNEAIAEFLDAWAEQQARRKAPQLFGAQSVLAYRQARRAQWARLRTSLAHDWRPIRASRLRRRANILLKQLKRR